jgi:hypothetical protein
MEEFFNFISEQYFLPFYLLVWLVAVARYRTFFDTPLKYYPIYLMYTFLTELLGYLVKYTDEFQFFSEEKYNWHNVIIFNIYSVIAFSFFFYIYWKVLQEKKHKRWVVYGGLLSLLAYLISLFFQDPLHMNLYYADLIASMVLLFDIGLYVKEKRNEEGSYPIKCNLMFWTTLGLAGFHAIFPYLFLIAYEAPGVWAKYQLRDVLKVLIIFMYGTFMIGALLGRRTTFR